MAPRDHLMDVESMPDTPQTFRVICLFCPDWSLQVGFGEDSIDGFEAHARFETVQDQRFDDLLDLAVRHCRILGGDERWHELMQLQNDHHYTQSDRDQLVKLAIWVEKAGLQHDNCLLRQRLVDVWQVNPTTFSVQPTVEEPRLKLRPQKRRRFGF